jgi:lipopolysaccharide/colanic/teichoic acid biosynthesis glycosyltransferase
MYSKLKRVVDFIFSCTLIIITLPFILFSCIIIFFETKRFPIFIQDRGITLNTYKVKIFKIRTIKGKDNKENTHDSVLDIFVKPELRSRVTPYAAWLRRTGLDELPQLLNIIFGKMSLIGPRPLMIDDLKLLKQEFPNEYKEREMLNSKPGISGIWQIFGDREQGVENLIGLDFLYDRYKSIYLDFKLFLMTIPLILYGKNSDAILYYSYNRQNNFINRLPISSGFRINFSLLPTDLNNDEPSTIRNYTIEVPNDWWYVTDTYHVARINKSSLKIIKINNDDENSEKNKSA